MLKIPAGSCDTHMHIYDDRYPLDPRWTVAPPNAPAADYQKLQRELGLERVVVVQPNAYGYDNSCTTDAIRDLGAQARGIAIIASNIDDSDLLRLHAGGMAAIAETKHGVEFDAPPTAVANAPAVELRSFEQADDGL